MSMHLHHPSLSLNGKKRGKIKFKSADAKRAYEQQEQAWRELKNKWGTDAEEKKRSRAMKAPTLDYKLSAPVGRDTGPKIPSLDTGHTGAVRTKDIPKYTGDKVIGVTIVHKSCLQPVFNQQEAIDAATMRR